jgi:hypothetical protein
MGALIRLLLGLFAIDTIAGEDGTIDRLSDSPTSKTIYAVVIGVLLFTLINFIKDFKIFK